MVRQTADVVTSVTMVVRVATERRVQAELTAFLNSLNVLIHRVHSLQDATAHFLELAKFSWFLNAIVLQIVGI